MVATHRSRVQHLETTIAQQTREIRQAKQAQDASLATIIKELRAANRKDTSGKPIMKGATNAQIVASLIHEVGL